MSIDEIKALLTRIQDWPAEAQHELIAVANQMDAELQGRDYVATDDELRVIDGATASIDRMETFSDNDAQKAFAEFRSV